MLAPPSSTSGPRAQRHAVDTSLPPAKKARRGRTSAVGGETAGEQIEAAEISVDDVQTVGGDVTTRTVEIRAEISKATKRSKSSPKAKAEAQSADLGAGAESDDGSAHDGDAKKKVKKSRKTREERDKEAMPLAARTTGLRMFIGAHVSSAKGED